MPHNSRERPARCAASASSACASSLPARASRSMAASNCCASKASNHARNRANSCGASCSTAFSMSSAVVMSDEPISNFSIQLKKHFRSYPEMISFSSKYFYGDSLQVMKIRGNPIEDVIEFDELKHDGLIDQRNVN